MSRVVYWWLNSFLVSRTSLKLHSIFLVNVFNHVYRNAGIIPMLSEGVALRYAIWHKILMVENIYELGLGKF